MGIDCKLPSGSRGPVAGSDAAQGGRGRPPGAEVPSEDSGFSTVMALWEAPVADDVAVLEPTPQESAQATPAELLAQTLTPWAPPLATPAEGKAPAAGQAGRGMHGLLAAAAAGAPAPALHGGAPGLDGLPGPFDAAETLSQSAAVDGAAPGLARLRPGAGLAARKAGGLEALDDSRFRGVKPDLMSEAGLGLAAQAVGEAAPERPAIVLQWEQAFVRHAGTEGGSGHPILSGGGADPGGGARAEAADLVARPEAAAQTDAPLQKQLSEQVSYWLGRHVQNAELTLEGPGRSAVEVSIALQGKEAHVEFRSDQLETRLALEGAIAQLREQLRADGLVLAGVSVGRSDAGQSSFQGRRLADKAAGRGRTGGATQPQEAQIGAVRAAALPSGRRLDLYV